MRPKRDRQPHDSGRTIRRLLAEPPGVRYAYADNRRKAGLRRGRAAIAATMCLLAALPAGAKSREDASAPVQPPGGITGRHTAKPTSPPAAPLVSFQAETQMHRSMPLAAGLEAGVGIFPVIGARIKQRELKRTDPMRDVVPRDKRIAAVGLRLSF